MWYEFSPLISASASSVFSTYDYVYESGSHWEGAGRRYLPGIVLPTVYVEEREDQFNYRQEGRQPTQTMRVVVLYDDALKAGMTNPYEYQNHLNDLFLYDGRYYKVHDYHVRGRLQEEVILGIQGYEIYPDQDMVNDYPPVPSIQDLPWPPTLEHIADLPEIPEYYGGGGYG